MSKKFALFNSQHLQAMPELASLAKQHCQPVAMEMPAPFVLEAMNLEQKLAYLREQKIGRYTLIPGPHLWQGIFKESLAPASWRSMLHLDYTASAQALHCIENYLQDCMSTYANTHTETSTTGKVSTQRFHQAIEMIRAHVHAGAESFVIPAGYGATGAIEKIQKILGLYLSPKGRDLTLQKLGIDIKAAMSKKAVVFVGPYEHHSNDVSWQDNTLCTFVRIKALRHGPQANEIDFDDLRAQLQLYDGYVKLGSFSAASNVTGLKCDLKQLGTILHHHNALFFVDFAASGPYADIDMERDGIDAIFLSLHKNLGGANVGFLIGRHHIYDQTINPSFGGGGTVAAVTPWEYHFHASIEERESAGTPAIRQTWQAALSLKIKEWVGLEAIQERDAVLTRSMIAFFQQHPKLELLGNPNPEMRFPIFSFLVRHGSLKIHHTLIAVLLNDLFGIQARSGCACAGPFGHELLGIERELSSQYVQLILNILNGFKPGWTRIGTHYTMSDAELLYTQRALSGIAWFGALFLDQYDFDPYTGDWSHQYPATVSWKLDSDAALQHKKGQQTLPSLDGEKSLHACWQNQLEEFYYLVAAQMGRLILQETKGKIAPDVTLDKLAVLTYPLIKAHVEAVGTEEQKFLAQLTTVICPVLAPPGKKWQECQSEIEKMLQAIIFAPQLQPHRFEVLSHIDAHLPFFYVAKGRLTRPILLEDTLPRTSCKPCAN